jgi:hypothetical protein
MVDGEKREMLFSPVLENATAPRNLKKSRAKPAILRTDALCSQHKPILREYCDHNPALSLTTIADSITNTVPHPIPKTITRVVSNSTTYFISDPNTNT